MQFRSLLAESTTSGGLQDSTSTDSPCPRPSTSRKTTLPSYSNSTIRSIGKPSTSGPADPITPSRPHGYSIPLPLSSINTTVPTVSSSKTIASAIEHYKSVLVDSTEPISKLRLLLPSTADTCAQLLLMSSSRRALCGTGVTLRSGLREGCLYLVKM